MDLTWYNHLYGYFLLFFVHFKVLFYSFQYTEPCQINVVNLSITLKGDLSPVSTCTCICLNTVFTMMIIIMIFILLYFANLEFLRRQHLECDILPSHTMYLYVKLLWSKI